MDLFTLDELTELCAKHDWFYNFSDDHKVWEKGTAEINRIRQLMLGLQEQGMGKEAKQIYENWRPEGSILGDAVRDLKALEVFAGGPVAAAELLRDTATQAPTVRGSRADARYPVYFALCSCAQAVQRGGK